MTDTIHFPKTEETKLKCKHCRTSILANNVDLANISAYCHRCECVFSFDTQAQHTTKKNTASLPKGFTISDKNDALLITYKKWQTSLSSRILSSILLLFAGIVFLFWGGTMALLTGALLLVGGLFTAYILLCKLINNICINASSALLQITEGPLPDPSDKKIINHQFSVDDIDQLYCKEEKHSNISQPIYQVWLITQEEDYVLLVDNLLKAKHALFIEQKIEQLMNIDDRFINGAYVG